jgi:hypothetical protein
MNPQDLGRSLRAIFDDRDRPSLGHRLETPQCPPVARLVELLEQGEQSGTPEERAHMAGCPFCQRMKAVHRCDQLREEAARRVAAALVLLGAVHLRNRRAYAAATPTAPVNITGQSSDRTLRATLAEDGANLLLAVYTDKPELYGRMVRYSLRGPDEAEAEAGYLVLVPDQEKVYSAHAAIDAQQLYEKVKGAVEAIEVHPVEPILLTLDDRDVLLTSARREGDEKTRAAWRAWLASAGREQESLPAGVAELLAQVQVVL